jgi:hypothetical protein
MTGSRIVQFGGGRTGTAAATWGQSAIWGALLDLGPDNHLFNIAWEVAAGDEGWSLPAVERALHELCALHESFRTRFRESGDGLRQVLDGSGEIAVPVYALDEGGAFERAAAALLAAPFDCTREWPLRVAVGCRGSVARRIAFVFSHVALDAEGVPLTRADFARLLAGASADDLRQGREVLQPLEQAAYQASAAGQGANVRALAYWERKLEAVPATMFPPEVRRRLGDPREPRFWQARLSSRAMQLAAEELASGWRTSSTAIVMAGLARVLGDVAGASHLTLQVMANNRIMPSLRLAVSPLAQEGLFVVEVGSGSFEELVQRTWKASLVAYKHAAYDKADLNDLVGRIAERRGQPMDRSCWFNDMRSAATAGRVGDDGGSLAEALAETEITWPATFERQGDVTFSLHIHDVPDTMALVLTADTHAIGPAVMESVLRAMEQVIVGAALARTVPA